MKLSLNGSDLDQPLEVVTLSDNTATEGMTIISIGRNRKFYCRSGASPSAHRD